jgi:hypothetical protein
MTVSLAECAELPVARVGGKAQVLGAALQAGFPVPPGVVVEPAEDVDPGTIGPASKSSAGSIRRRSPATARRA